jgi:LPXTG-site transpeptidase (sortase) family protein
MRHFLHLHKKYIQIGGFLFGTTLLVGGSFLVGSFWYYKQKALAATPVPIVVTQEPLQYKPATLTGKPVRLQIPSLDINLEVIDGVYSEQTHQWTLTTDKAQFATITAPANNEKGNTYIYGHYRPEVFARLHKISESAVARVETDNGLYFTYTYRSVAETTPNDVSSLLPHEGSPTLSIQTCSGTWFQNRQIYTFDFKEVESKSQSQ